ncbi:S41 family peptidase [Chlorobaculum parvum]|uniref:S41 family peptidase n=1 Tax=Chlorobaculum parvum TaxID=274539 RepID=UPI001E56F887|nr:S41 family peptidase [Chlorobaculum parvum]
MSLLRTALFRRVARWPRFVAVASVAAMSVVLTTEPVLAKTEASSNFFEVNKSIELLGDVYQEVSQNYVEPIDVSEFMYSGIDGMLGQLDPYTVLLDKEQSGELDELTSGQYAGIGVTIGTIAGDLYVTSIFEGQAAAKAGLQVGDKIVAVNGVRVGDRPIEEIRESIKGRAGTTVRLTVRKDGWGARKQYRIARGEVRVSTVSYSGLFGSVAYIRMTSFARHSRAEMVDAIRALQQQAARENRTMSGLVFDLRGNPGGLLNSAVDVAALFVEKGSRVVSTKGRAADSEQRYVTNIDPLLPSLPLVVLIDGQSASAAEIVAGAIQELDRGLIVGENSFGKGLVQSVIELPYDHSLKITTAKYYTPSGRLIQKPLVHGGASCQNPQRKVLLSPETYDSTKVYYTLNHRKVYGGGGIKPDFSVSAAEPSEYEKAQDKEGLLFTYATNFHRKHRDISLPKIAATPVLKEFREFVDDKTFVYRSAPQRQLDSLKTMIGKDGGEKDSLLSVRLQAFDEALASWTKQGIQRDSLRITTAVQREIIRHYDEKAAWRKGIELDPVAAKAFALLADPVSYQKLLKP